MHAYSRSLIVINAACMYASTLHQKLSKVVQPGRNDRIWAGSNQEGLNSKGSRCRFPTLKKMGITELESEYEFKTNVGACDMAFVLFFIQYDDGCKQAETLSENLPGLFPLIRFYKVDAAKLSDITAQCNISQFPTCCLFKNGVLSTALTGVTNLDQARDMVEANL